MKSDIRDAFEETLQTWAAARVPALKIAWQNVPFTPPKDSAGKPLAYLRAWILPADTTAPTVAGDLTEYRGIFQVDVVCPAGVGPQAADGIAAEIVALFPAKTRLTSGTKTVLIATPMSERPALQDVDTYAVPCWCRYTTAE